MMERESKVEGENTPFLVGKNPYQVWRGEQSIKEYVREDFLASKESGVASCENLV